MANETLKRDENRATVLAGVTDDANQDITLLRVDPTTKRLKVSATGIGTAITVKDEGSTITSGVTSFDFVGSGVTATNSSNAVTVTIPGSTGGATTALDNLASVALNTALLPATAASIDHGSATKPFKDMYLAGSSGTPGTNNFKITGASTSGTRTVTLPDASGTATLLGNSSTGSGNVVLDTSPTLVTPTIGVATATSVNKVTITAPATSATLTIANGKTLTASNSITVAGTDGKTLTVSNTLALAGSDSTTITFQGTDTYVGRTTTDTLTNKTLTAPKIANAGFVADANGNEQIIFNTTASAVNEIAVTNAATGTTGPLIQSSGETNVDLRLSGKGTGKVHNITGTYDDITADSDGATITFNMATSNVHSVTLGGNRTLAVSNVSAGQRFMLRLLQDGTGSRTVTWFTTIKWAGGSAPTLTTTASKADLVGFLCTSAGNYDGFVVGQNI
jgi:hypothetical protein